jgi:hypothetical protein
MLRMMKFYPPYFFATILRYQQGEDKEVSAILNSNVNKKVIDVYSLGIMLLNVVSGEIIQDASLVADKF